MVPPGRLRSLFRVDRSPEGCGSCFSPARDRALHGLLIARGIVATHPSQTGLLARYEPASAVYPASVAVGDEHSSRTASGPSHDLCDPVAEPVDNGDTLAMPWTCVVLVLTGAVKTNTPEALASGVFVR